MKTDLIEPDSLIAYIGKRAEQRLPVNLTLARQPVPLIDKVTVRNMGGDDLIADAPYKVSARAAAL